MSMNDQEIVGLIECFRNRLRKLILVEPLMDHLHFLEDDEKELIRVKMTTQGNLCAVDQLLETISKRVRPMSWFMEFIDALEAVGCTHAASYIINSPPSPSLETENDSCVRLINLLQMSLVRMKTRDVCVSCYSLDILTEEDHDNIITEIENKGNISGARLLLRRLVRNETGWFSTFLRALQKTGHPDLVKELMGEDLVDEEEIDLYTDPDEQLEQASANKDSSCTSDAPVKDELLAAECPPVVGRVSPPVGSHVKTDGTSSTNNPPAAASTSPPSSEHKALPQAVFTGLPGGGGLGVDAYDYNEWDDCEPVEGHTWDDWNDYDAADLDSRWMDYDGDDYDRYLGDSYDNDF
ncbi:interferon-induced helicase C domain-containing protein 1-like [Sardina pilchardus]|uniref:interferon-induced helicase C domain-containing protein 1-like n=1 Tax=Sardina pilchardus TaxID=27697 RepID=UPI002E133E5A